MYARVTRFAVKPEHNNDETIAKIRAEVPGRLRGLNGFLQSFHLGPRDDNHCVVVSFWESAEAAEASLSAVQPIWTDFAYTIDGTPEPEGYEVSVHITP